MAVVTTGQQTTRKAPAPGPARSRGGAYEQAVRAAQTAEEAERRRRIEAAYREHYHTLVEICRERGGDPSRSEDFAQETLVRALRYRDGMDLDRPPLPWLRAIAIGLITDDAERRSHNLESVVDLSDYSNDLAAPDLTEELLQHPALLHAMASLTVKQHIALRLRFFEDWSGDDAARFIGVTRGACDQLVRRAKRRLRAQLQDQAGHLPVILPVAGGPGLWTRLRLWVQQRRGALTAVEANLPGSAALMDSVGMAVAVTAAVITSLAASPSGAVREVPSTTVVPVAARAVLAGADGQPLSGAMADAATPASVATPATADGADGEDGEDGVTPTRRYTFEGPSRGALEQAPPTHADALLVEEEDETRVDVSVTVSALGYEISVAELHWTIPCDGDLPTSGTVCRTIDAAADHLPGDDASDADAEDDDAAGAASAAALD